MSTEENAARCVPGRREAPEISLQGTATSGDEEFLGAIYAGQPFRTVFCDLGLTPNHLWPGHRRAWGTQEETGLT